MYSDRRGGGRRSDTKSLLLFTSKVSKGYQPTGDEKTSFSWDPSSLSCVHTTPFPSHVIPPHLYTDLYESKVMK